MEGSRMFESDIWDRNLDRKWGKNIGGQASIHTQTIYLNTEVFPRRATWDVGGYAQSNQRSSSLFHPARQQRLKAKFVLGTNNQSLIGAPGGVPKPPEPEVCSEMVAKAMETSQERPPKEGKVRESDRISGP